LKSYCCQMKSREKRAKVNDGDRRTRGLMFNLDYENYFQIFLLSFPVSSFC
jgi:hypothetical protein